MPCERQCTGHAKLVPRKIDVLAVPPQRRVTFRQAGVGQFVTLLRSREGLRQFDRAVSLTEDRVPLWDRFAAPAWLICTPVGITRTGRVSRSV